MKYKFLNSRLFNFFRRLFDGNNPESMSQSENMLKSEKKKIVVENKLRWEDDGGPVFETDDSSSQVGDGEKQFLPD